MAIEILSAVPDEFFAGDTVKIRLSSRDYPSPTWTYKLALQGPEAFTITADPDGEAHLFTIASATTSSKTGGVYGWTLIAESGGERATIDAGSTWMKPDPTVTVTSWAKTCLTLLRAHISGRLPSGLTSHTINGTSINKMSLPEAVKLEQYYSARVAAEDAAKVGVHNDSRTIQIYFGR